MAWKKTKNTKKDMEWKNKNSEMSLYKVKDGWRMDRTVWGHSMGVNTYKYFKTKTQALAYAKKWMKEHHNR